MSKIINSSPQWLAHDHFRRQVEADHLLVDFVRGELQVVSDKVRTEWMIKKIDASRDWLLHFESNSRRYLNQTIHLVQLQQLQIQTLNEVVKSLSAQNIRRSIELLKDLDHGKERN